MPKCAICGKNILLSRSNWKVVTIDGETKYVHKRCPKRKAKITDPQELHDYKALIAEINNQLKTNPKGNIETSGLNFKKVIRQIKELKDAGYSYSAQLYALKEVVHKQGGFYGYTAVCNNIAIVMGERERREKALQSIKEYQAEQEYDLSVFIKEDDYDW